jgi:16S rRNA (cytidine1402-2'-O)-methyltransferase
MKDQEKLPAALYMVSTPIGNLEDITLRALRILKDSDCLAAEDTRESKKLLEAHGITREIQALHAHSSEKQVAHLAEKIEQGQSVAYISDAGTPGLCDPGAELVRECFDRNLEVVPIPGASALLSALAVSGFLEPDFQFHGFFPRENKEREEILERLRIQGGRHFFYESPHRFLQFLNLLNEKFPAETLLVAREVTKKFETISKGTVAEIAEKLSKIECRGEYVVALELEAAKGNSVRESEIKAHLKELISLGAGQKILTRVAMQMGMAKNAAYDLALSLIKET